MKETPIIMSGNHPKLILDGIKTQTRRVINPQPDETFDGIKSLYRYKGSWLTKRGLELNCPYGQVGDRLWVRETWHPSQIEPGGAYYKADGVQCIRWKPSIFMPRWASRITLEITEVRAERLQEITEEDAKQEGAITCLNAISDYKHHFMILWDSLNAKRGYGWETNCWVWCISFKVAS